VFPRSPAGFLAAVLFRDQNGRPTPAHGVVQDISLGGLALGAGQAFGRGARLYISFVFPGDDEATEVEVEVVGTTRGPAGTHISHCRFLWLCSEASGAIEEWVEAGGS
jgi:hypothetical protein